MILYFTKMQSLGNDFVMINAIRQPVRIDEHLIKRLADRHFGVGCDQVLVVEAPKSPDVDFYYRIFNADGGEVLQCGNGARCFARFVVDERLVEKRDLVVETAAGTMMLKFRDEDAVSVELAVPSFEPDDLPFVAEAGDVCYVVDVEGESVDVVPVSVGNPHAVVIVDDVDNAPVKTLGKKLMRHERFPLRTNVPFIEVVGRREVRVRVYERGAGETLACGSGAAAAVIAACRQDLVDREVDVLVHLQGGDLTVCWLGDGEVVVLSGSAEIVFKGKMVI